MGLSEPLAKKYITYLKDKRQGFVLFEFIVCLMSNSVYFIISDETRRKKSNK